MFVITKNLKYDRFPTMPITAHQVQGFNLSSFRKRTPLTVTCKLNEIIGETSRILKEVYLYNQS
ncbi:hypothetical protein KL86DYS1_30142 [uncultured Dysgonomonas sp.]|uniref:Uncharacterized protein n=1 Tax=uncultured Dysgonomonas sp. TaxID=206096 RepID=A0A212JRA4_9BACT|nr:hypothetical protein KL86DYS1_30142 [uncultured Dysgonomonas sp.]